MMCDKCGCGINITTRSLVVLGTYVDLGLITIHRYLVKNRGPEEPWWGK